MPLPYDDISSEVEEIASGLGDSAEFYTPEDVARSLSEIIAVDGAGSAAPKMVVDKDESKSADELLDNALEAYNQKYGLTLTSRTLTENLKIASFLSRDDKNIQDLVERGILGNAANHLYFKTLMSLYKMIDKTVQNVTNSEYAQEFSIESMMVIDKLFTWLGQLEELKEKYKLYDFDKTMHKLIDKAEEQDTTTVNPIPNLVKQLMHAKKSS